LAAVVVLFFFVATLIAGSTWCPMRAMAAPSAGVADACAAKVNETADAVTRANKVIFIRFLLDDLRTIEHRAPKPAPAASRTGTSNFRVVATVCLTEIGTALSNGARTALQFTF
jgi:hypothetical protein